MANSESEDFESADEEVVKVSKDERNPREDSKDARNLLQMTSSSDVNPSGSAKDAAEGSSEVLGSPVAEASNAAASSSSEVSDMPSVSPESLGAKPKIPLKANRRHSKEKSKSFESKNVNASEASSRNKEGGSQKSSQPKKLGTRIPPAPVNSAQDSPSKLESSEVPWKNKSADDSSGKQSVREDHDSYRDSNPNIPNVLDKLSALSVVDQGSEPTPQNTSASGWGSWGSWGVSTLLSGASSVTSHVSQGISSVTSAIETGLGAVGPEEMARLDTEEKKNSVLKHSASVEDDASAVDSETDAAGAASSGLLSMGNVLKFVESTGGMIVSSGLNTLETIGKKTMDVLQEGDPGLKKKRALLAGETDKPCLSQVLREARAKADIEDHERTKLKQARKAHFESIFDDYRGMVHLEALEMLSQTCQMKLEAKYVELSGSQLIHFQRILAQIKEQCELPDDEEDDDEEDRGSLEILDRDLSAAMRGLMVPLAHTKLIRISEDTDAWLNTMKCVNDEDGQVGQVIISNENEDWVPEYDDPSDDDDPHSGLREIHAQAIRALARFTAGVTEHFHKMAELLLVKTEHNSSVESHCLVMMTTVLCSRVSSVAARFSELLSAAANGGVVKIDHNDVNSLITNVFLEASNSSSYIQDASNLLIPVLQLGAVQ